jgi:hypothetical protein
MDKLEDPEFRFQFYLGCNDAEKQLLRESKYADECETYVVLFEERYGQEEN